MDWEELGFTMRILMFVGDMVNTFQRGFKSPLAISWSMVKGWEPQKVGGKVFESRL